MPRSYLYLDEFRPLTSRKLRYFSGVMKIFVSAVLAFASLTVAQAAPATPTVEERVADVEAYMNNVAAPGKAKAALVEEPVIYKEGSTTLEGFHVYDKAAEGKRPAVLIIHQWTGLTEYEKRRARMLAEMGYNVFAADIYGQGVRPQPPEAGQEAGNDNSKGAAYNEAADKRSWEAMKSFFAEIFK